MTSLRIDPDKCRYKAVIGVGGIGSGSFFLLNGNHTIGREESRGGRFLDRKDYCKLHIIAHYIKVLLGQHISVIPIGKIGNDDVGNRLLHEMEEIGFNMKYVEKSSNDQTLYSFCFLYPAGDGGNLTTSDSACSKVDTAFVARAESEFICFQGHGIALAAPEVPLKARETLLKLGKEYDFFKVTSLTSEEVPIAIQSGMLKYIDLLAINLDEAAAFVEMKIEEHNQLAIVDASMKKIKSINPDIQISITYGKDGSWSWDGNLLKYVPAYDVKVENTAGAGDAFFAGLIVGLTVGLSLQEAQQFATLTGSHSVMSPHTINKETNRESLLALYKSLNVKISKNVKKLLED